MEVVGWYVLVPLALGAWLTGSVMALGTKWGLFRHWWVLLAFVLTTLATVVLVVHMGDVSEIADRVRAAADRDVQGYGGDLVHAVLALVLLVVIQVLNLYKPSGVTRYGWRKANFARVTRHSRTPSA